MWNFEANDLDPHVSWAFICTSKLHVKYNYTYTGGFWEYYFLFFATADPKGSYPTYPKAIICKNLNLHITLMI